MGKMFFVLTDSTSKWLEVKMVVRATSASTKLWKMFATHGLPKSIVSYNGSVFTSEELNESFKKNNICHICTAQFHPSSNRIAERYAET